MLEDIDYDDTNTLQVGNRFLLDVTDGTVYIVSYRDDIMIRALIERDGANSEEYEFLFFEVPLVFKLGDNTKPR